MDDSLDVDLDSFLALINGDDSGFTTADVTDKKGSQTVKKSPVNEVQLVDLFCSTASDSEQVSQSTKPSFVHTGDTSSDEEDKEYLSESGQHIKKKIKVKPNYDSIKRLKKTTWTTPTNAFGSKPSSLDNFSGIRIVNPLISFDTLETRMQGRKLIKMSLISNFIKKGDIEGDWVTVGVVVRKIPPKTSKTGKIFSIWKLTDLHNPENLVTFFLFGQIHNDHWKTAVGTVIGLLNPTIMPPQDNDDGISIMLDNPGKVMLMGTSKDFGHCKGKRKDGERCTMIVNLSQCEYCVYHVRNEYKKFSQRSEIQTSYSGREPSLKNTVLKGQNYFYGGQTFALGKPTKKSNCVATKDKLTLSNLTLKRKATEVFYEEKDKGIKKLAEMYGNDISKVAEKNSEFINSQLVIPSAGSKHFLHMMKSKIAKKEENVCFTSPKELLKQHELLRNINQSQRKDDSQILNSLMPQLGKGLSPGQNVCLGFSSQRLKTSINAEELTKLRAIRKIKENGPIERKNPNCVKSKPEQKKIEAALNNSLEENSDYLKAIPEEIPALSSGRLGCIDLNSDKIQRILKRKSSHAYEVEMAAMEKEAAYFAMLEKKEFMEEKMISTKEIVCDVVSCKQCRYTAHSAAERCKQERHPLKCHKAIKRFYACKDCKQRTTCFTKFPFRACRCGGSNYERTGMHKLEIAFFGNAAIEFKSSATSKRRNIHLPDQRCDISSPAKFLCGWWMQAHFRDVLHQKAENRPFLDRGAYWSQTGFRNFSYHQ